MVKSKSSRTNARTWDQQPWKDRKADALARRSQVLPEIVINLGRDVGNGIPAIAQIIEKDATYGSIHRFLYGIKSRGSSR